MINYDLKKIKGLAFDVDGVLSRQTISLAQNGEPLRTINIRDGYAIQLAVKKGLHLAIITGGKSESVYKRYESLGVQDIFLSVSIKIKKYEEWLEKCGLKDENVIYVGDDIPDYEIMQRCGCPCCPRDAAIEIRDTAIYESPYEGGNGCCRDVIEQVMRAKGLWMSDKEAFGW